MYKLSVVVLNDDILLKNDDYLLKISYIANSAKK